MPTMLCTPLSSPSGNRLFIRKPTPTSSTAKRASGIWACRSRRAGAGSKVITSWIS